MPANPGNPGDPTKRSSSRGKTKPVRGDSNEIKPEESFLGERIPKEEYGTAKGQGAEKYPGRTESKVSERGSQPSIKNESIRTGSGNGGDAKDGDMARIHNRTVLSEHEIDVENVMLRESHEFSYQKTLSGKHYRTITVHTRVIGDRVHQLKKIESGNRPSQTFVNTTLPADQINQFEADWSALWRPQVSKEQMANIEETAIHGQPKNPMQPKEKKK